MTDSVPEDQTAATPPAAHESQNGTDKGVGQNSRRDRPIQQGEAYVHYNPGSSQDQRKHGRQEQPVRPLTPSTDRTSQAEEREHRRAEQRHWKWSIITSAASAAGAVAAAYFAWSALSASWQAVQIARDQTDIARNASLASTRAWINVTVDPTSVSLTWDKAEQPTVKVTLKGTNEGSSPAIDVQVFPVLFFPQSGPATAIRGRIRALCAGVAMAGNIVFVKDGLDQTGITSPQDDLVKSWIDRVRKKIAPDQLLPVPLSLALCAAYKIVGDDLTHHTARIYDIGRVSPTGSLMPVLGENMTADHISLRREYDGEYAD